jgi:hypothetical protein
MTYVWVVLISIHTNAGVAAPLTGEIHAFSNEEGCEAWASEYSVRNPIIFVPQCQEVLLDN